MGNSQWWRNAVVYQIYPRSFSDSNGDGVGDIKGLTNRIGYLDSLGVNAIWLSPFYPSPLADGGYDVVDYRAVDVRLGTIEDFDALVVAAHSRGIKIIVDIVPNHTSDQHPWFREALSGKSGSPERNRYIFRRGKGPNFSNPPTNWQSNFGGSAWEPCGDGWYYLHIFAKEQPDLNWSNPEVMEDFEKTLRFWCNRGVDGFRVDVSHALSKDLSEPLRDRIKPECQYPEAQDGSDPIWDRNEVHEIYRRWRKILDSYPVPKYAIGETWSPFSDRVFQYARKDELGAVFDFSLLKASWNRDDYKAIIDRTLSGAKSVEASPTWVLGNHDVPRAVSRLGLPKGADLEKWVTSGGREPIIDTESANRRARSAALILLGLPGTAFLYQGEELGLPEDFEIPKNRVQDPLWERTGHQFKGRDGCRVPLPWEDDSPSFGFSSSTETWLPQPCWFSQYAVNKEERDSRSCLSLYRDALTYREKFVATDDELDIRWVELPDASSSNGLCWELPSGMRVMVNFSSREALPLPKKFKIIVSSNLNLSLRGYERSQRHLLPPESAVWLTPADSGL